MLIKNFNPIVIIEDDVDDQELFEDVFKELNYPNERIYFEDGDAALEYLNETKVLPFLILSDINMPKLDGFALRNKIKVDAALQLKCIPYIFFSTSANQKSVVDAYSLSVQGFFVKQTKFDDLKESIDIIMKYWNRCVAPNQY